MKLLSVAFAVVIGANQAAVTINPVTSLPQGKTCTDKTIYLNERDKWILRLTPVAGSQQCSYQFNFPSNCYALVNLTSYGVGSTDKLQISDTLDDIVIRYKEEIFMSNGPWPTNVTVMIKTGQYTKLQFALNVTIVAARPMADVTQVSVGMNMPSSLQYFSNWPVGKTYRYKGQSGAVGLYPAGFSGDISVDAEFRKVFVYNNGMLIGSLMSFLLLPQYYNSTLSDVMLYAPMQPMTMGVVMVTDFANVNKFANYKIGYVPYNSAMMTSSYNLYGVDGKESALTIVGAMDMSNPIDVLSYGPLYDGNGMLSVASGGPMASHSSAMALSQANLPKHLTGNIWTFYLSSGSGNITIHTVSN